MTKRVPLCHPDRKHRAFGKCDECYRKDYYWSHREEGIIKARDYYQQHREEHLSYKREYYQRNREHLKSINKKRYQERAQANPQKMRDDSRRQMWRKLGIDITDEEYDNLFMKQNGRCAICGREPLPSRRLSVDHCHTTGKIRGLLCGDCNRVVLPTVEKYGDKIYTYLQAV